MSRLGLVLISLLLIGIGLALFPPPALAPVVAPVRQALLPVAQPLLSVVGIDLGAAAGKAAANGPAAAKKSAPPAMVRTQTAKTRDVPIHLEGIGNVQARSTVAIKSRVDGQLFEAAVREGQLVKTGEVLFRLDPRPYEAQLKQVEAALVRDRANLEKAEGDVARFADLAKKGISPQTRLEESETLVRTLRATIAAAQAAIELAKLNLSYTTIKAPIDGRVGSLLVSPGNMVKANDTQALIVLTEISPIHVTFAVPEQFITDVRERMRAGKVAVEVRPQGDTRPPIVGELFFINNAVDVSTGTIQLTARFDNVDERLVPGQFVRARATLDVLRGVTVAPDRAVQINQRGHYVYVAKPDNTVELRQIEIGPEVEDEVVVKNGLAAGETIVTDGQLRLFPGARIQPAGNGNGNGGDKGADKAKSKPQT